MHKILERSNGILDIHFINNNIKKLFQSGCAKILNPKSYNDNNEIVMINTSGGITCNDKIEINIFIENSDLSFCTQAAEKVYAGIGDPAKVEINVILKNSNFFWLPKELILFNNSKLDRKIKFHLFDNSNLIFCETSIFGRKAMNEKIKNIFFSDHWKIYVKSNLKHFEAINIKGSIEDNYKNNFTFNNHSALSTILIFGEIIHFLEPELRKIIQKTQNHYCEMSKFNDKIIIRSLAEDNYDLKKTLNYMMKNIIYDKLPRSWDL